MGINLQLYYIHIFALNNTWLVWASDMFMYTSSHLSEVLHRSPHEYVLCL